MIESGKFRWTTIVKNLTLLLSYIFTGRIVLAVDDTLVPRSSEKAPGADIHFDHTAAKNKKRFVLAQLLVSIFFIARGCDQRTHALPLCMMMNTKDGNSSNRFSLSRVPVPVFQMRSSLSVSRNAGISMKEIKESPVLYCGVQGAYPYCPLRNGLSVCKRADLFHGHTGALCDNIWRYAVCEKISSHFSRHFFFAFFNAALFHFFFFHFYKKRPWHVFSLPSQLLVIFPMLCPQFFIAQIEDARDEEHEVAFFVPTPAAFGEEFGQRAEIVEILYLLLAPRGAFPGVQSEIHWVVARQKLVVVQIRQHEVIILIKALRSKERMRIKSFLVLVTVSDDGESHWFPPVVRVNQASIMVHPLREAASAGSLGFDMKNDKLLAPVFQGHFQHIVREMRARV
jgi:hypothetical protein